MAESGASDTTHEFMPLSIERNAGSVEDVNELTESEASQEKKTD
jgi:hypothetical protein